MKKGASISVLLETLAESLSAEEIIASTVKADVANQITEWRVARNMNQQEMADYCGVQQSTISKWENGDLNFTIEKMAEIACKLDFNLSVSLKKRNAKSVSVAAKISGTSNVISLADHFDSASASSAATLRSDDTYLMEG